ncbi:hypothetical protein CEUSTIGMA_g11030.t1 [Chlamydomonas eustigma]|uniref:Integrase catalytic domain-containing protein n=1 Tax=Chlamydomonas eustigma TaxID=1157962 RepID=A0A250XKI5_9CHLO|nr:hypothetical protein CEUSTIGMA_g11030.t1 [Chlamydomonas eustigma]|eukprot:GAX83605.1 hypothetical protein CEUSTIGMA_g11030.t1 [Chlamydomonas eustigma]
MTQRSSASSSTYRAASHHHYQQRDSRPDDPMELGAISTERHHQSNRFVSNRSSTPGPSHRRSTTPAPPPRTSTAGLTKLTDADRTRRALVRRGSPKPQIPQLSISSEPCLDPRSLSNSYASSSGRPPSLNPIAPSPEFSSTSVLNLNSAATCDYSQQLMTVQIAAPLTDLTRSTVPFPPILPPSAVDSFNQLKTTLLSAPLLLIPHTGLDSTFILYTDAFTLGLGAVLLQDQGQGPQPVCYESRKLTPAERNYSTHELELLAIVHAVKIFRHYYLEGCQHFTLFTDHHSLRYFFTQKDLSRRQVRWAQDLAVYQPNMSIIYKDGKNNHADALSRLLPASLDTSAPLAPSDSQPHSPPSPAISSLLLNQLLDLCPTHVLHADPLLDDIKAAYALDPLYADSNPRRPKYLLCRDSLWYLKDRICVPSDPALRLCLLHEYHDTPTSGHPGYLKTLNSIASHYWWPRMTRTVKSYVSSCATCQRIKPSTQLPPGLLQPHAVPVRPWSHVSMDLITDLPKSQCHDTLSYDSIVTFVDMLTKQAIFIRANKSITYQQLAHVFIDHVFSKHGLPSVIVSDRNPRITSEFWQTLFTQLGSKLNLSTAHYHPQTDGQTEITHRTTLCQTAY